MSFLKFYNTFKIDLKTLHLLENKYEPKSIKKIKTKSKNIPRKITKLTQITTFRSNFRKSNDPMSDIVFLWGKLYVKLPEKI